MAQKTTVHGSQPKVELKKKCLEFSILAVRFADSLPDKQISWLIGSQFLRAATGIGVNITQAKALTNKKEYTVLYESALKSASETLYWLGIIKETQKVKNIDAVLMEKETESILRIISATLKAIKEPGKK